MKNLPPKKLSIKRDTLRELTADEARRVVGGVDPGPGGTQISSRGGCGTTKPKN